ncbi:MAG: serine hydrolase [Acidobacteria bacterium]|nr:serine hydrolase [Acidobacteriota bacterium]
MPDGKIVPPPGLHHSLLLGAGGICSTAGDLVKWTHALHTGKVLAPATYTAMTTPKGVAASANYGLGIAVRSAPWAMAIAHGGQSQSGHTADLQWYPEKSLAFALLYNAAPRVPNIDALIPRVVMGMPLPAKKPEPRAAAPQAAAPSAPATPAERTTLTGVYELRPQRTFEVTLEKGELYVTRPEARNSRWYFAQGIPTRSARLTRRRSLRSSSRTARSPGLRQTRTGTNRR